MLKEAGVVDAGAQGLFVLLDGMLRALRGEAIADAPEDFGAIDAVVARRARAARTATARRPASAPSSSSTRSASVALDADAIRAHLQTIGRQPARHRRAAISCAFTCTPPRPTTRWRTRARSARSRTRRRTTWSSSSPRSLPAAATRIRSARDGIAVVAIGAGDGIEELLRSIGAAEVVRGGQTMNPSAGDIRAAIEATGAREVIVLPDNKNVVLAAELAVKDLAHPGARHPHAQHPAGRRRARRHEPRSVVRRERRRHDGGDRIRPHRRSDVRRARHARSTASTIAEGQPIGLVDGDLVVAEATVAAAVRACVALMVEGRDAPLVTLYIGEGEDAAAAEAIAEALRTEFGVEVEVVAGGQPHYPYLIGVE